MVQDNIPPRVRYFSEHWGHVTTVSAGAILVLATFAKDVAGDRRETAAFAALAVVAFVVSIIAGTAAKWGLGEAMAADRLDAPQAFYRWAERFGWGSFIAGFGLLGLYAIWLLAL